MAEPEDMIVPLLREMRTRMIVRLDELGAPPSLRKRLLAALESARDAMRLIVKRDMVMKRVTLRDLALRLDAFAPHGAHLGIPS
jgi:hypothetical protein